MQDPKKNSFIFSFKSNQLRIIRFAGLFFLPIIIVAVVLELAIVNLPSPYKINSEYLEKEQDNIEIAVFGSSQIKNSVNPQFISRNSINLSSTAQHHNIDFKLLKGVRSRLSNLKTVVFEVSYSHFEIPHNTKYYWKNSVFLKYYNINTFDHPTSFSDQLLYVSNPGYFSKQFINYYLRDSVPYNYNKGGFDLNLYEGKFKKLGYDPQKVQKSFVKINRHQDTRVFEYNVAYFKKMLDFCKKEGLNVVIISPPTFNNYNALRIPSIVKRRDSILSRIAIKYPSIKFLNCENDRSFKVTEFRNENHLNPDGAKRFSKKLDSIINSF